MGMIYAIRNKISGATYIGSSIRDRYLERWMRHKKDLRSGRHHCRFLQRAWDKYGQNAFDFKKLEEVDDSILISSEQKHLDYRKSHFPRKMTYNICWTAGNCSGVRWTKERKRRASESRKGRKMSKMAIVRQKRTYRLHFKNPYSLRSPDGKIYRNIRSIRGFARKHGLNDSCLRILLKGEIRHHKGWTVTGRDIKKFNLVNPTGIRYDNIVLLKKFCIERNLPYKQIHKLFRGIRTQVRGWTKG